MGLDSAFVDRARVLRQEPAGARVRGMTQTVEIESAWFPAFLQLPQGNLQPDTSQGRRRVVRVPTLMFDVYDEAEEPVEVHAGDRVEIESDRFGQSLWEVSGEPEPLATLVEIIGWQVRVQKVSQREFRPVAP